MIVHEILEKTNISRDTFRFYEKEGLLEGCDQPRSSNGYRNYAQGVVDRINMVRLAKTLGFSLKEIRDLVIRWEKGLFTKEEKIELFTEKIRQIHSKMQELQKMERYLEEKIEMIRSDGLL